MNIFNVGFLLGKSNKRRKTDLRKPGPDRMGVLLNRVLYAAFACFPQQPPRCFVACDDDVIRFLCLFITSINIMTYGVFLETLNSWKVWNVSILHVHIISSYL